VTEHVAVIAVTASALGDAPQVALDAGCVDFIPKPVRAQALFAALQKHLGVSFVARPPAPPAAEPELNPDRRAVIARRIRDAAGLGDITAVDRLIADLVDDEAEMMLGRRVQHLARTFDFDALNTLANDLSPERCAC
jgi:hypothetical protein